MSKIPEKCKAMVLEEYGKPDVMREVEIPEVKEGDILVKVQLAGICGTDVHQNLGDLSIKPPTPMIQGHETLGRIVEIERSHRRCGGDTGKKGRSYFMGSPVLRKMLCLQDPAAAIYVFCK